MTGLLDTNVVLYIDDLVANGLYQITQETNPGFLNIYATSFAFNATGAGDVQTYQLATQVVPEPGTGLLVGAGMLGLLAARRRARRVE